MRQVLPVITRELLASATTNNVVQVRVHRVVVDEYLDCYIMPLTHEYVSIVTQASHDEAQRRYLEHHAYVRAKFVQGGGIDTVDPRFPIYPHIVHFLRDKYGSTFFTKAELIKMIEAREYNFSTLR